MRKQWIYELILAAFAIAIVLYGFYVGMAFFADEEEEYEPESGYSQENENYENGDLDDLLEDSEEEAEED